MEAQFELVGFFYINRLYSQVLCSNPDAVATEESPSTKNSNWKSITFHSFEPSYMQISPFEKNCKVCKVRMAMWRQRIFRLSGEPPPANKFWPFWQIWWPHRRNRMSKISYWSVRGLLLDRCPKIALSHRKAKFSITQCLVSAVALVMTDNPFSVNLLNDTASPIEAETDKNKVSG